MIGHWVRYIRGVNISIQIGSSQKITKREDSSKYIGWK